MAITLEQVFNSLNNALADLQEIKKDRVPSKVEIGHTFRLAGVQWKVLDAVNGGYLCLAEKLDANMKFDNESNDWRTCKLREYLNDTFYKRIAEEISEENIITFKRNLLSLDGQTEYEDCEDKVSLMDVDEYRKYRSLIPNADYWWWLITPWSTKCNGYTNWSAVVSPHGNVNNNNCNNNNGVRPFWIPDSKSRHQAKIRDRDTKRCVTFRYAVNTKEFFLWMIKVSLQVLTICIKLTKRLKQVRERMAAVRGFR